MSFPRFDDGELAPTAGVHLGLLSRVRLRPATPALCRNEHWLPQSDSAALMPTVAALSGWVTFTFVRAVGGSGRRVCGFGGARACSGRLRCFHHRFHHSSQCDVAPSCGCSLVVVSSRLRGHNVSIRHTTVPYGICSDDCSDDSRSTLSTYVDSIIVTQTKEGHLNDT